MIAYHGKLAGIMPPGIDLIIGGHSHTRIEKDQIHNGIMITQAENKLKYEKIKSNTPIIGFTGALGSGCSYFAKGLEEFHNYFYFSLSTPIHDILKKNKDPDTAENLQKLGNALRERYGRDALVAVAMEYINENISDRYKGIVIDGIRNTGEIEALNAYSNFFLFSIHANQTLRFERLNINTDRFRERRIFDLADKRDQGEDSEYGQQVQKCNYLADILINNEEVGSTHKTTSDYEDTINTKLYKPYIKISFH